MVVAIPPIQSMTQTEGGGGGFGEDEELWREVAGKQSDYVRDRHDPTSVANRGLEVYRAARDLS